MKKTLAFISLTFIYFTGLSQQEPVYFCGQLKAQEKLFSRGAHLRAEAEFAQAQLEAEIAEYTANRGGGDNEVYTIPVVFHIIHDNGDENISDAQIFDAISILTRDFRKQNQDSSEIVEDFTSIASDCGIEFALATIDPDGNCHSGINRIQSDLTYDGYDDGLKQLSYWPRSSYLNIWVCNTIGSGTAGFTYLPGDVSAPWLAGDDGIVLKYSYVGSIETSSETRSRTLTHEVGHWINLYHTWGPGNSPGDTENCDQDDNVSDTPNCIGTTTCSLAQESCEEGVLANVQNYMEYSYCSVMFTYGQRVRMRAALNSNTAQRNQLITQANLIETGVIDPPLCVAAFTSETNSICLGDTIYFIDQSYHNVTEWTWNFGDATTMSGSDPAIHKNPMHVYTEAGTYNVTLEVSNGNEELSQTINSYVTVFNSGQNTTPFIEGFENTWPANNWSIYNQNYDETFEVTPTAEFSGDKSLKLRNYNNELLLNKDILYSATYDMTGATVAYIDYKWAFACKSVETDDILRISVSGDCGQTWSVRKIRKGLSNLPTVDPINSQFTPTSTAQWDGETITLSNATWFTTDFRVKFEFEGKGGNNLFLDDINITSDAPVNVDENAATIFFNVYPNPSEANMTLELVQPNTESMSISLYDVTGKLCSVVYDGTLSSGKHLVTLPKQPSGLYLLVMKKEGVVKEQRIIFE